MIDTRDLPAPVARACAELAHDPELIHMLDNEALLRARVAIRHAHDVPRAHTIQMLALAIGYLTAADRAAER